jgi:hypothetical protein
MKNIHLTFEKEKVLYRLCGPDNRHHDDLPFNPSQHSSDSDNNYDFVSANEKIFRTSSYRKRKPEVVPIINK